MIIHLEVRDPQDIKLLNGHREVYVSAHYWNNYHILPVYADEACLDFITKIHRDRFEVVKFIM